MKNVSKLTIPQWATSDRPREKFLAKGKSSLTDAELIAILLRNGSSDESALDLAKRLLLLNHNSLNSLSEKSIEELMGITGIGIVKAITIQTAFELGQRRRAEKVTKQRKITTSADVLELMQGKFFNLPHEEFWVIYLNHSATLLRTENVGKGGLTSTTVDVRLIMKRAIELSATAIVLCHNHPSGDLRPSQKDIQLTQQIKNIAAMLNISLLDHIIIYNDYCYSFSDDGIL